LLLVCEVEADPPSPTARVEAGVGEPSMNRQGSAAVTDVAEQRADELLVAVARQCKALLRESEAVAERRASEIIEDARRQARELLEEAQFDAKRIVGAASQERALLLNELAQERSALEEARTKLGSFAAAEVAEQRADELLATAARECEVLRRESQVEAARITEDAQRQSRDLLEKAELEAARIVAGAGQERAWLVDELARERSVLEETRTRLSGFLADVLDEVEVPLATSEGSANDRDPGEARGVGMSASLNRSALGADGAGVRALPDE